MEAGYLELYRTGQLELRVKEAQKRLQKCTLCPHGCGIDRTAGERGFCQAGEGLYIAGYGPHFGEESSLVGTFGSGTIFFTYCNMRCVFCQNYLISTGAEGKLISVNRLAEIMLELQEARCHNINFVSPSHYVPQIIAAVELAVKGGLTIPLVYNSGGYDSEEALDLLEGVIDIYMPDLKYSRNFAGQEFSGVKDYFTVAKKAIRKMHDQVGDLVVDENGLAVRGLIVRHLVLPMNVSGTEEVVRFIVEEISPFTYINIMDQYYPKHEAGKYPSLCRPVTREEYKNALRIAKEIGPNLRFA